MFNVETASEEILADLTGRQIEITREAIMNVLEEINKRYDFDDVAAVADAIRDNMRYLSSGAFGMMVCADLWIRGIVKPETIPENLSFEEGVLERLAQIEGRPYPCDKVAYIVLNSNNSAEVIKKCSVTGFCVNDIQLLMPLFQNLSKIDSTVKEKIVVALSELTVATFMDDVPTWIDDYCFSEKNHHPDLVFRLNYGDKIPVDALNELKETFVVLMLQILKEYLQG